MKRLLLSVAVLPFLAGVSLAVEPAPLSGAPSIQPAPLSDRQMDTVTAGFDFWELDVLNGGATYVLINHPAVATCSACFLSISGTSYPIGYQSFQLQAMFGP